MSISTDWVKKTFLISPEQDEILKRFSKHFHISGSQWLRLQIDQLRYTNLDTLAQKIENDGFKVNHFLGAYDGQEPIKEIVSDQNGHKQARWFKKFPYFGNMF